jgi:hypothetical protein
MACDTTDVHLFDQVNDCCDRNNANPSHRSCSLPGNDNSACCSSEHLKSNCEDCCKDEVVYLKKNYELTHSRNQIKVEPVPLILEVAVVSLLFQVVEERDEPSLINYIPPPPTYVGREFVLFTHQFKVG